MTKCIFKPVVNYKCDVFFPRLASYHKGRAYIIDVSQSVTPDHPHSLDFLRKDCTNITGLLLFSTLYTNAVDSYEIEKHYGNIISSVIILQLGN